MIIPVSDCSVCGAPYELLEVENAIIDEDGELVEPAMFAEVQRCGCDQGH